MHGAPPTEDTIDDFIRNSFLGLFQEVHRHLPTLSFFDVVMDALSLVVFSASSILQSFNNTDTFFQLNERLAVTSHT